jgi:hypothetical protein
MLIFNSNTTFDHEFSSFTPITNVHESCEDFGQFVQRLENLL